MCTRFGRRPSPSCRARPQSCDFTCENLHMLGSEWLEDFLYSVPFGCPVKRFSLTAFALLVRWMLYQTLIYEGCRFWFWFVRDPWAAQRKWRAVQVHTSFLESGHAASGTHVVIHGQSDLLMSPLFEVFVYGPCWAGPLETRLGLENFLQDHNSLALASPSSSIIDRFWFLWFPYWFWIWVLGGTMASTRWHEYPKMEVLVSMILNLWVPKSRVSMALN